MKKIKGLVLGICFCGVAFALGGCGASNDPCLILVSDAKTQFEIGEEFSFSDNMKIDLVFENEDKMALETPANYAFVHDPINKIYAGMHYTIDYSAFDSTKGGSYPIFVDFKEHEEERDIRVFYLVDVERYQNTWMKTPILNNWTYGQTPIFEQLPLAHFNNESLQYSYRNKSTGGEFVVLPKENICQALEELNAGEYELNVAFTRSYVYEALDMTIDFKVDRANLPVQDEEMLENIEPQEYTGSEVLPNITGQSVVTGLISIDYTSSSQWVNAGVYQVPIEINPNYKWKDTDDYIKYFEFEILRAQNSWLNSEFTLAEQNNVFGWTQGEFTISKVKNVPNAVYGQVSFAYRPLGEDGDYADINIADIGILSAGQYELKAYIKESNNYTSIAPIIIEFEVFAQ